MPLKTGIPFRAGRMSSEEPSTSQGGNIQVRSEVRELSFDQDSRATTGS